MNKPTTSPTGWWIAGLLEKHAGVDRAPFWNNYRLVRATDWRTAFRKASEMDRNDASVGKAAEDGAELLFEEIWPENATPDECPMGVFSEVEMKSLYEEPAIDFQPSPVHPDDP